MEQKEYSITPEAGAYVDALKLLDTFQQNLYEAYDRAFGEWDGFYTEEFGMASRRELEQKVVDSLLEPIKEHFKQVLYEEISKEHYNKSIKDKESVCA
jgi:hypothetical protein